MDNSNQIEKYVSHLSAARLWQIPKLNTVLGEGRPHERQGDVPIEITVLKHNLNFMRKDHIVHFSRMELPRGAVVKKGGVLVASPEMVFLQFARKLSIQRLILLGLQMCSHDVGRASEAITTKRKLKAFLERSHGYDGHVKAERAINYIENGSASIKESTAFMMLTLPYRLGGYGFGGARLNQEFLLDAENRKLLQQKKCYVDIYYPKARTAIEYDSFAHHSTPEEQGKDSVRALALTRQGINVISMKTIQLHNEKLCEQFAQNLAAHFGKRLRNKVPGFEAAHKELRKILKSARESK